MSVGDFMQAEVSRMKAELLAMKQRAEAAEDDARLLKIDAILLRERAEAAEARIKASQEQDPVPADYIFCPEYEESPAGIVLIGGAYIPANQIEIENGASCKLYAAPVIPPDVAVLQRKLEEAQCRIAELEDRK